MSRYSAEGFRAWQRAAAGAEGSIGEAGCCGFDGYNGCLTGNVSSTIGENCGMSTGRNSVVVLNDQGGTQMDVSEDVTGTLRTQEHGHQPCVLEAAGFCTEHSANARSIGYEEERSPTLRARVVPAAIALENHPADSRVKISEDGKVQTLTSRCGTGGGNVPMVMDTVENSPAVTLKIRSGCEGGGKGAIWQEEKSATLGCNNDQTLFVPKCYGVCSKASHSMMSDNPHSGFYEAETSRTLDRSGGDPTCNQGGLCICEPVVCVDQGGGKSNCTVDERVAPPLACTHGGAPAVAFSRRDDDMKKLSWLSVEDYGTTPLEVIIVSAMKGYLGEMPESKALKKIEEVFDPKVIRLFGDDGAPMPVQSTVDGAKFAAFIDEAVADVVKRMESDMSDIGQIALEALRDIDGKVIVETMSPEFVSFLGDVYRSLKFDK